MPCAWCSGIVWATAHLALTLCPWKPPVHLFIHPLPHLPLHHAFFFLLLCTNLSLVSTSKQKRLSMDSVLRRMQDLSVRCVRPCGGEAALETSFICSNRHRISQYRVIIIISCMKQSHFHDIVKQQEVPLTCHGSVLKKSSAGANCDVTVGTEHTHCQMLVPTWDHLRIMAFVKLKLQL